MKSIRRGTAFFAAPMSVAIIALTGMTACDRPAPNEPPAGLAPTSMLVRQVADLPGTSSRALADDDVLFTRTFRLEDCDFRSVGRSPYFPLIPGQLRILEGISDGVPVRLEQRVLHQTLRVGGIETRVLEERHFEGDELIEVSRNFFAHCMQSNSVFYFGEDVDNYEDGKIINHNGTWRHGVNGAQAGLQMPGLPLIGARYYQEIAPTAQDRAEILRLDAEMETRAGRFRQVLVAAETTPLEPGVRDLKSYAPGIGLIADNEVRLVMLRGQ